MVDLLLTLALITVLSALAIPQMMSQRRLLRSTAVTREIMTQIRYARQMAMTQRRAFTFQYDNVNKTIAIINNNAVGTVILADAGYPNNPGSVVVSTTPLTAGGLSTAEIAYGIPGGLPTNPLPDGISLTGLTGGRLNITFQPDGSVIDVNGNPLDRAFFIYNTQAAQHTAAAISVAGSAGRIKLWRYNSSVNSYAG